MQLSKDAKLANLTESPIQEKIIIIRNQKVIVDADVAELYGVEAKRINEAVKNNPEKFPDSYLFELNKKEWGLLKSKFSTSIKGGKVKNPHNKSHPRFLISLTP